MGYLASRLGVSGSNPVLYCHDDASPSNIPYPVSLPSTVTQRKYQMKGKQVGSFGLFERFTHYIEHSTPNIAG